MTNYAVTICEDADDDAVSRYRQDFAKLKPSCTQCDRTLTKSELAERRCADRYECGLRCTFKGPVHAFGGKPLNIAEVRFSRKVRAARAAGEKLPAAKRGRSAKRAARSLGLSPWIDQDREYVVNMQVKRGEIVWSDEADILAGRRALAGFVTPERAAKLRAEMTPLLRAA